MNDMSTSNMTAYKIIMKRLQSNPSNTISYSLFHHNLVFLSSYFDLKMVNKTVLTLSLTLVISLDGNRAKSAFTLPPALRLMTSWTTSPCKWR